ncbi:MAG: hypothetical protein IJU71_04245 [Selenomonadaceae bacterium]|nr:hypothetical protein [Selenomonadaceae bacterium]
MAIENESASVVVNAARASKQVVTTVVEATKEFFNELLHPNMTIEKISEIAAPRLDDLIEQNEENGLKYAAGKFKVGYVDEEHFAMAFEMYFKDADGKWYKSNGNSDPRDAKLLDIGSWKTLQTLKSVEFPITAPEQSEKKKESTKKDEAAAIAAPTTVEHEVEPTAAPKKSDIDLEDLLGAKKAADPKLKLDKD